MRTVVSVGATCCMAFLIRCMAGLTPIISSKGYSDLISSRRAWVSWKYLFFSDSVLALFSLSSFSLILSVTSRKVPLYPVMFPFESLTDMSENSKNCSSRPIRKASEKLFMAPDSSTDSINFSHSSFSTLSSLILIPWPNKFSGEEWPNSSAPLLFTWTMEPFVSSSRIPMEVELNSSMSLLCDSFNWVYSWEFWMAIPTWTETSSRNRTFSTGKRPPFSSER